MTYYPKGEWRCSVLDDQWLAVLQIQAVRSAPVGLRRFGRDLVLWRDADQVVRCALDVCPHRGAALHRGRVVGGELQCPYHGLRFAGDGRCQKVPAHPDQGHEAAFGLRVFEAREAWGLVWVWTGPGPSEANLPWDEAFEDELRAEGGRFWSIVDAFDVSYLRVMENLTDYHHVAFVHRWTAPTPSEVTAFTARREGRHIWTSGRLGETFDATTHIVGPCLAIVSFAGLARFAVIATPIDENAVWLFARYTQQAVKVPGLHGLLGWALGQFDYRLLQRLQDLPVWRSQRLDDPGDISRYTLLPADEGIRLYFEMHEELR